MKPAGSSAWPPLAPVRQASPPAAVGASKGRLQLPARPQAAALAVRPVTGPRPAAALDAPPARRPGPRLCGTMQASPCPAPRLRPPLQPTRRN